MAKSQSLKYVKSRIFTYNCCSVAFTLQVEGHQVGKVSFELHQQIPQKQQIKEHKSMQFLICSTYLKQQYTLTKDKTSSALYAVNKNQNSCLKIIELKINFHISTSLDLLMQLK